MVVATGPSGLSDHQLPSSNCDDHVVRIFRIVGGAGLLARVGGGSR